MDDHQKSLQLLQDVESGTREAFDRFYEEHIEFVFNIALHIVKDRAEAEDVCHDVFLEVYQKTSQYESARGSVKAWLAVKTKSRSLDRLRKKKPILSGNQVDLEFGSEELGADHLAYKKMEGKAVRDALKHIPTDQREAIYRSYFQEESHKEIAKTMQKPLGSVKSLIRYGINNLRKQKSLLSWTKYSGGGNHNE